MDRTDGSITLHQAMVQMAALVNEEGMAHERECWDVIERALSPRPTGDTIAAAQPSCCDDLRPHQHGSRWVTARHGPTGDTAHHWDCRAQDGGTCERYVNGGSCVCRCHDARPTGTFADMDHTGHGRTGDTAEDPVTVGLRRLRERHGYLRPTGDTALENRAYRIIERTANMGFCSQTNHEHLMLDARKVESALASPAPTAAPGLREAEA